MKTGRALVGVALDAAAGANTARIPIVLPHWCRWCCFFSRSCLYSVDPQPGDFLPRRHETVSQGQPSGYAASSSNLCGPRFLSKFARRIFDVLQIVAPAGDGTMKRGSAWTILLV